MTDNCLCTIHTTEKSRSSISALFDLDLKKAAAPFGISDKFNTPEKLLIKDRKKQHPFTENRLNTNLHAKMLIFKDRIVYGSGNFTDNSIHNEHEIYSTVHKDCHPEKYSKLEKFFDTLWERSTELKGINDTI